MLDLKDRCWLGSAAMVLLSGIFCMFHALCTYVQIPRLCSVRHWYRWIMDRMQTWVEMDSHQGILLFQVHTELVRSRMPSSLVCHIVNGCT